MPLISRHGCQERFYNHNKCQIFKFCHWLSLYQLYQLIIIQKSLLYDSNLRKPWIIWKAKKENASWAEDQNLAVIILSFASYPLHSAQLPTVWTIEHLVLATLNSILSNWTRTDLHFQFRNMNFISLILLGLSIHPSGLTSVFHHRKHSLRPNAILHLFPS